MIFHRVIQKKDPTCEIHTVKNGREGIDFLASDEWQADIIFLDLFMPETDGWYFLEHFEGLGLSYTPVLLVVSSSINPKDIENCKGYPFVSDYLSKPFLPAVFEKSLAIYHEQKM
jgi:CheY-like chemotaxis protein